MPKILNLTAVLHSPMAETLCWRAPDAARPAPAWSTAVFAYAHAVLAAVLRRIHAVDTEAARHLHDPVAQVRRWAVSPLLRQGAGWSVELAIPSDPLADIALRALQGDVQLEEADLPPSPLAITFPDARIASAITWAQLTTPSDATKWRLYFPTPTAMAMPGGRSKVQLPLPLPSAMLESWRRVWNQECPAACHISEETGSRIAAHLAVTEFSGGTSAVTVPISGYQKRFIGFTGQATLALIDAQRLPPDTRAACQALLRFAPYCSTGKKTAWGLGVTRLAEP